MNRFIQVLKAVVLPVEVASLLFVCFAAALISGGIEVLVMDKLLNIPEFGAVGQYIPIVLVTIMEVLKIFLIFYSQRLKQAGKAYRATIAKGIHILLIGF